MHLVAAHEINAGIRSGRHQEIQVDFRIAILRGRDEMAVGVLGWIVDQDARAGERRRRQFVFHACGGSLPTPLAVCQLDAGDLKAEKLSSGTIVGGKIDSAVAEIVRARAASSACVTREKGKGWDRHENLANICAEGMIRNPEVEGKVQQAGYFAGLSNIFLTHKADRLQWLLVFERSLSANIAVASLRGGIEHPGMAKPKIKCGVAGVGSLGQHHARIYASLPNVEFVGIFEANDARAAEICARHNCRRFATLAELGDACDAISVVVPTDKHAEVALPLLAKGCHLLIEKPLCASLEEAEQVLAAARQYNCLVQVGHIEHFNPVMSYLEKHTGRPQYITTERLAPYQTRGTEVGVVLDLMIHDIGIVLALVKSPIRKIDSVGINVLSKTEDIANARIEFENNCVANLSASRMSLKKNREIRVFQDNAYLSLDFMNQKGHLVKKSDIIAYGVKLKIGLAKAGDAGSSIPVHEIPIEKGEPLAIELTHFVESVNARLSQPKVGGALGKSALWRWRSRLRIKSRKAKKCRILMRPSPRRSIFLTTDAQKWSTDSPEREEMKRGVVAFRDWRSWFNVGRDRRIRRESQ